MLDIHPDYWRDALLEALPELEAPYAKASEPWDDGAPPYIFYGDVVMPWITALLKTPDASIETLSRAFEALERLAGEADLHFTNLLRVEVFERLSSEHLLSAALEYCGPQLRRILWHSGG